MFPQLEQLVELGEPKQLPVPASPAVQPTQVLHAEPQEAQLE
jgi:hypothetical protein